MAAWTSQFGDLTKYGFEIYICSMAHPHFAETRAQFPARVHRTKSRLVSIPADVTGISPGDELEIKIHRLIEDVSVGKAPEGAALLIALAGEARPGWRSDGSEKVDEYLRNDQRDA
jgi:hypothetical protein